MPDIPDNSEKEFLGDLPPLLSGRANQKLERRQVSIRWLGGAVLTGLASVTLMGGALYAALDGRQQLAIPAQAYEISSNLDNRSPELILKGTRPGLALSNILPADNDIMMVSTVSREADRDVVKIKPFLHIISPLAIIPRQAISYPQFDALAIFSETGEPEDLTAKSGDLIYGANVDGEVTFKIEDFPYASKKVSLTHRQNIRDISDWVRKTEPQLDIGTTALAAISYFDPGKIALDEVPYVPTPGITITTENVSVLTRTSDEDYPGIHYEERLTRVRSTEPIESVLRNEGLQEDEALQIANALSSDLASSEFQTGDGLEIFFENNSSSGTRTMARISVYRGGAQLVSVAKNEAGEIVYTEKSAPAPQLSEGDNSEPLLARSKLPSTYDAIYRAALNEGLTSKLAKALIRIFAFDVDFKSSISQNDSISLFLSIEDGEENPTNNSEILFASITLGGVEHRYYRFPDSETGRLDYYDKSGQSAKQFLLRQPVPNGRFNSPFGMRRHPITRVYKPHTGVDWSAPRGTPILAAGNAVVEKAGWSGGYGYQTILRHANGYETSYSHQSGFAPGIRSGVRVRQGQIIGYVGSTGLSTGAHLHYEVIVNDNKVDPMRIKLPRGKVFTGRQLQAYEIERDRIDALLKQKEEENQRLAQY